MTAGTAVGALMESTTGYMATFLTEWGVLVAIPLGIMTFGLVLTVVVGALRKRD